MIKRLRLLKNNEAGQALILVLCMLVLGSFMMVPLLNLSATSIQYHETVERNTVETYSAEAGVEYALGTVGNNPDTYKSSPLEYDFTVNGKNVSVNTEYQGNDIFKITSIATDDNGNSTTIESYAQTADANYSFLMDNAITSPGDVTLMPGTEVYGDVQYNGELSWHNAMIYGDRSEEPILWPPTDAISSHYWDDVAGESPFPYADIDIKYTPSIGPLYRDGSLNIDNTKKGEAILTLNGTVYITGDLVFEQPGGSKAYTLDLNGNTIFVEGTIYFPPQHVYIFGNGCIIAIEEVHFQPHTSASFDHFVFVISLEDIVHFQPHGNFQGSLAGNIEVHLQPQGYLEWIEPPEELNFPGFGDDEGSGSSSSLTILTWQIN
ncbi:hypothetical protein ACFLUH_01400 [Chloroflexota bacterium]